MPDRLLNWQTSIKGSIPFFPEFWTKMFSSGIVIIIRLGQKVSSRGVACDEFIVKLLWIPVFSQIISHPISLPHENTKWHAKSIILRLPYSYHPLANSLFIKPAEKSFFASAAAQNCYVSI